MRQAVISPLSCDVIFPPKKRLNRKKKLRYFGIQSSSIKDILKSLSSNAGNKKMQKLFLGCTFRRPICPSWKGGTFFRLQAYEKVRISLDDEVRERVGKSVIFGR